MLEVVWLALVLCSEGTRYLYMIPGQIPGFSQRDIFSLPVVVLGVAILVVDCLGGDSSRDGHPSGG